MLLGHFQPDLGAAMKPLGDGFIKLVKMIIAPVIFLTIVVGIAKMGDLRHVGRIGLKALIYFELLTTAALVIGLVVANTLQPGAGMGIDPAVLDSGAVAQSSRSICGSPTPESSSVFRWKGVVTSARGRGTRCNACATSAG